MPSAPPPSIASGASIATVVVAAGRGHRLGLELPKQYAPCGPRPLLATTLMALHAARPDAALLVVIHPDDAPLYIKTIAALPSAVAASLLPPASGGATRQASVARGLEALVGHSPDIVLIHDAARPFPDAGLIARAIDAGVTHAAAAPGIPLADTIVAIDAANALTATPPRAHLRATQTPQSFRFPLILAAHRRAAALGIADLTDDAAVARAAGHAVHIFEGQKDNFKVTTSDDFARAGARLAPSLDDIRVGQGFDVHALAQGDHVWLCGLRIAHDKALTGHSDADVALHALADAIYGALGDGDIGAHFPPSDERWRGAASSLFLEHAAERVRARGGTIAHCDITLVCEAPKIGPHREAMRARVAQVLGLDISRVGVKATTSEGLGFTGRREGIAALATATVRLPEAPR